MKRLKCLSLALFMACCCVHSSAQKLAFDARSGIFRLGIDSSGQIKVLEDLRDHHNYLLKTKSSYLLTCRTYEADSDSKALLPLKIEVLEGGIAQAKFTLLYPRGIHLSVGLTTGKGYFKMELLDASPAGAVSQITWGPYYTSMDSSVADVLGLNRSWKTSIALMTLDPNTDGPLSDYSAIAAARADTGSFLQLTSFDHTRGRFVKFIENGHERLRNAFPLPGKTVIGSKVILGACKSGRQNELDFISGLELAEGLPHPLVSGVWNKLSDEPKRLAVWAYHITDSSFAEYLQATREMGANILCRNTGFFRNWGHFDFDARIAPLGINSLVKESDQAAKSGIGLTLYTLTTFLKPMTGREPYLAPHPDDSLAMWKPLPVLGASIDSGQKEISLPNSPAVFEVLGTEGNKVIRIGNELIEAGEIRTAGSEIKLLKCERGAFYTTRSAHLQGAPVKLMVVSGYHNFYPGTLAMNEAFVNRMWDIVDQARLKLFITDGFESCLEMGYGYYAGNLFMKHFYDRSVQNQRQLLLSGSGWSNYTWHIFSHFSWGENDRERGFRGSSLDSRLLGQRSLRQNDMPDKLGQYYPSIAGVADIEWAMAMATGWESGIDLVIDDVKKLRARADYPLMLEKLKLWQQAQKEHVFTEKQKMDLRQTNAEYKLSKTAGKWDLRFVRFWKNDKVRVLPSSMLPVTALSGGAASVRPCSIDWNYTHNPAVYDEVVLSDDLILQPHEPQTTWKARYIKYNERKESYFPSAKRFFLFVLRVPKEASSPVKNIRLNINGHPIELPITLKPGEYLSIPQLTDWACIYDQNNRVIREFYFHNALQQVNVGVENVLGLSAESTEKNKQPMLIMNLRNQNGFFF